MRWYEANSEQLDPIGDVVLEHYKQLQGAIKSARQAGLSRQYDMLQKQMVRAEQALHLLGDIRRQER